MVASEVLVRRRPKPEHDDAKVVRRLGKLRRDPNRPRALDVRLPGGIPVEEVLFFLVAPLCSVLALEAVRRVTGWDAGYPAEEADA